MKNKWSGPQRPEQVRVVSEAEVAQLDHLARQIREYEEQARSLAMHIHQLRNQRDDLLVAAGRRARRTLSVPRAINRP